MMGTPAKTFNPDEDFADLSGKVIFITEGTTGPAHQTALALAAHAPSSHIYLTGPSASPTTGHAAAQAIERAFPTVTTTFIACDLSSLAAVALAAHQFTSASPRLDLLICSAACAGPPASSSSPHRTVTHDGYEAGFGVNHVGHALLVKLLLPTLLRTTEAPFSSPSSPSTAPAGGVGVRVVLNTAPLSSTSSMSFAYRGAPPGVFPDPDEKTLVARGGRLSLPVVGSAVRDAQCRLAGVLYARELARRYPSVVTVAVAVVQQQQVGGERRLSGWSCLDRALACVTGGCGAAVAPEEGVRVQVWAATATATAGREGGLVNGGFYERVGVLGSLGRLQCGGEKLARQLWDWTEKELEAFEA